jgi:hypothetical protein
MNSKKICINITFLILLDNFSVHCTSETLKSAAKSGTRLLANTTSVYIDWLLSNEGEDAQVTRELFSEWLAKSWDEIRDKIKVDNTLVKIGYKTVNV